MERFPRGTLPPSAFAAVATIAPNAITRREPPKQLAPEDRAPECDLSTTCPNCSTLMQPEHAHYKCGTCGYRDSCCF
jgi:hypothetical protein